MQKLQNAQSREQEQPRDQDQTRALLAEARQYLDRNLRRSLRPLNREDIELLDMALAEISMSVETLCDPTYPADRVRMTLVQVVQALGECRTGLRNLR